MGQVILPKAHQIGCVHVQLGWTCAPAVTWQPQCAGRGRLWSTSELRQRLTSCVLRQLIQEKQDLAGRCETLASQVAALEERHKQQLTAQRDRHREELQVREVLRSRLMPRPPTRATTSRRTRHSPLSRLPSSRAGRERRRRVDLVLEIFFGWTFSLCRGYVTAGFKRSCASLVCYLITVYLPVTVTVCYSFLSSVLPLFLFPELQTNSFGDRARQETKMDGKGTRKNQGQLVLARFFLFSLLSWAVA